MFEKQNFESKKKKKKIPTNFCTFNPRFTEITVETIWEI